MKQASLTLFILSLGFLEQGFSTPFLEDRERGWYWFEEFNREEEDLRQPQEQQVLSSLSTPNLLMQQLQQSLQTALNLAILRPTEDNVARYLKLHIKTFELAQRFTRVAKLLQVNTPELDYQIQAPYHQQANLLKNQQDRIQAERACQQLAQTHGLFFFFDSHCPYCVLMAPIVLKFAKTHQFHLIPVSVEGGSLPEFPNAVLDNGISGAYGVTHLPALFAVNPKTQEVLKLANRLMSQTELEDTVLRQRQGITGYGN